MWVSEKDSPNRDVAGLGYAYFHWRGGQCCTLSCLAVIPFKLTSCGTHKCWFLGTFGNLWSLSTLDVERQFN